MALTFVSTRPERVHFIEENPDGRDRYVTATRDPQSSAVPRWNLEVTHPSGWRKSGTYTGPRVGVGLAIDSILEETRSRFVEESRRGDRPPYEPHPLAGSVPVPSSPALSMPSLNMRYRS